MVVITLGVGCGAREKVEEKLGRGRSAREASSLMVCLKTCALATTDRPPRTEELPRELGVPFRLPKAASDRMAADLVFFSVWLHQDRLYWNGKPVAEAILGQRLRDTYVEHPQGRLIISALPTVPYGRVVRVMDLAIRAGLRDILLRVGGEQAPTPVRKPKPVPRPMPVP
jgi:biopolymer transport protein ExbD